MKKLKKMLKKKPWIIAIVALVIFLLLIWSRFTGGLNPARNLTGTWVGTFTSNEDIGDGTCLATGDFILTLKQRGNNLEGDISYENLQVQSNYTARIPMPCAAPVDGKWPSVIEGSISSSALELRKGSKVIFTGSFTTDLMRLTAEACVIQQYTNCKQLNKIQDTIKLTRK